MLHFTHIVSKMESKLFNDPKPYLERCLHVQQFMSYLLNILVCVFHIILYCSFCLGHYLTGLLTIPLKTFQPQLLKRLLNTFLT